MSSKKNPGSKMYLGVSKAESLFHWVGEPFPSLIHLVHATCAYTLPEFFTSLKSSG